MIDLFGGIDLLTVLISTGVFAVLAVSLYMFSVYGVREKTYEEALEEQRKRNEASLFQSKSDKGDKFREKRFKKPWGKRAKEKQQVDKGGSEVSGNESGATSQNERVVFKAETEVIPSDPDATSTQKTATKSKKSKKNAKPILVNKTEEPQKEAEQENRGRSNSFNLTRPRDEVELKHLQEVEAVAQAEEANEGVRQRKKQPKATEPEPEVKKEAVNPPSTPAKKQKKAKNESSNITAVLGDSIPGSQLAQLLKNSILSDGEIQQLIDILLNRQQGGNAEWTRKGDPVVILKKQLQETEKALEDEQRLTQSAGAKLKDMRSELISEKSKLSQLERQMNVKIQTQQGEIQALHTRMCHSHDQHVAESSSLQKQIQQLQSGLNEERVQLQRLQDENKRLKDAFTIKEAEASNISSLQQLQAEVDKYRANSENYEACQAKLRDANNELRMQADQLNKNHQEELKLKQHITDLTTKINQAEQNKQGLLKDIKNLQSRESKYAEAQNNTSILEKKLADSENQYIEIKSKCDNKISECAGLQKTNDALSGEVKDLKEAVEASKSELEIVTAQNNKLTSQVEQTKVKQNGDVHSISADQHDQLMSEKDKTISHLRDELNKSISSQDTYKDDLEKQKLKNNASLEEEQELFRNSYKKVLPNISVDNSLKFKDWLGQFEKQAIAYLSEKSKTVEDDSQIEQLKSEINNKIQAYSKLQSQCQMYQDSLSHTESLLHNLQTSVNKSYEDWEEKSSQQEAEYKKISLERDDLLSKLTQVQSSNDMQTELRSLQSKLQTEEVEKKSLSDKYQEAEKSCTNLQENLDRITSEMEDLKKISSESENFKKQIEDMKAELEKEKKNNKELSAQTVKLNSLVKIGQDSIKAEVDTNKKLQDQLDTYKSQLDQLKATSATNGDSTHTNASPVKQSSKR